MAKVKDKERILKAAREKQSVNYKGTPIRLSADFYTETLQARREWQDIFKALNGKNLQPRILSLSLTSAICIIKCLGVGLFQLNLFGGPLFFLYLDISIL